MKGTLRNILHLQKKVGMVKYLSTFSLALLNNKPAEFPSNPGAKKYGTFILLDELDEINCQFSSASLDSEAS